MHESKLLLIISTGLAICALWSPTAGLTDGRHEIGKYFDRQTSHGFSFLGERDDKGNEAAGQTAAWLLLVANLPVAVSLLIKGANRISGDGLKKTLANFNRIQKKTLMGMHCYLNLAIFGIVLWHWLTSRCKSSALPEVGLTFMVILILFGVLLKFKLCPKSFRSYIYKIHTQPLVAITTFLIITAGHIIVD